MEYFITVIVMLVVGFGFLLLQTDEIIKELKSIKNKLK